MQTTVKIALSLNLDAELVAKPLKLTKLRNALVKRRRMSSPGAETIS
jgi:hypothetical protein